LDGKDQRLFLRRLPKSTQQSLEKSLPQPRNKGKITSEQSVVIFLFHEH